MSKPESTSTQSRDYNICYPLLLLPQVASRNQHQPSRGITTTRLRHAVQWTMMPESTSTQSRDYNFTSFAGRGDNRQPESTSTQSRDYNHALTFVPVGRLLGRNQHQPSRGITTAPMALPVRPITGAGININPVAGCKSAGGGPIDVPYGQARSGPSPALLRPASAINHDFSNRL